MSRVPQSLTEPQGQGRSGQQDGEHDRSGHEGDQDQHALARQRRHSSDRMALSREQRIGQRGGQDDDPLCDLIGNGIEGYGRRTDDGADRERSTIVKTGEINAVTVTHPPNPSRMRT
jgi:hypothetical protein